MEQDEIGAMSALELAEAVRTRRLSPVEVIDATLARIAAVNPAINAYCTLDPDGAREAARAAEVAVTSGEDLGPLHGVPVSIKDVVFTRGVRTTRGSAIYGDLVPEEDSPIVDRLKAAGAIIIGKTNTPEFGWKAVTDNALFGQTANPWDLARTPGGSSGGSAAALAAGLGPLSIGTDGAGSIRIPASFSGVVGLKPSFGRVPFVPASAAEAVAHAGPMTRTVADAALLLQVISGPDPADPNTLPHLGDLNGDVTGGARGLRLAWSADLGYVPVEPEVARLCQAAAERFAADLGCQVEAADPGFADPYDALEMIFHGGIAASLVEYMPAWRERIDLGLVAVFDQMRQRSAFDLAGAGFGRRPVLDAMNRLFARYDLLLTPTMPMPAFPLGTDTPLNAAGQLTRPLAWTPFTYPFNLTGHPAISIPCGLTSDGLPVGLQIVGPRWADTLVLRAAAVYEAIAPWPRLAPPLPAGSRPSA